MVLFWTSRERSMATRNFGNSHIIEKSAKHTASSALRHANPCFSAPSARLFLSNLLIFLHLINKQAATIKMTEQTKELKEYTTEEVSKHTSEDDCWMIIGNEQNGGPQVYDVTKYLDDHPGGAEVMLDLAGQNADEFFEDIGHSQDARNELKKYLIGTYKMTEEELEKMRLDAEKKAKSGGASPLMILLVVIVAIIYAYTQDLV